jgi:methylglyoxal synthase
MNVLLKNDNMHNQNNNPVKKIAIVVDDSKRNKLVEWSYLNKELLRHHHIIAADETALILSGTLTAPVTSIPRGTQGGYRQLANMLSNQEIDLLICLGSPEKTNNFQTGISDLIALAVEKEIMLACNEATANILLISLYDNAHSFSYWDRCPDAEKTDTAQTIDDASGSSEVAVSHHMHIAFSCP